MISDYKKLKEYLNNNENPTEYLLVKGDISGIQSFIFNVHGKGSAKNLRGKSAYINFLTLTAVHRIIDNLNLDKEKRNVIYVGGGNFYIIIPKSYEEQLEKEKLAILNELNKEFKGELYLNIDWEPISKAELDSDKFKSVWKSLNDLVRESGNSKWSELIEENEDNFFDNFFTIEEEPKHESEICTICRGIIEEPKESSDEEKICGKCETYIELGKAVREAKYLKIEKLNKDESDTGKNKFKILGYELSFYKKFRKEKEYTYEFNSGVPEKNLYFPTHTPMKKDEGQKESVKEFTDLAEGSIGAEKLGILKLDVDNLGTVFSDKNLPQLMKLSKKFKEFFEGKLNSLAQTEKYKNDIYIIYSGGDDTFILGSYDKLLDFTNELRKKFKDEFKDQTFSAGLLIIDPKENVMSFAKKVEEYLDKAKERKVNNEQVKDGIVIFGETFSWEEYTRLLEMKTNIRDIAIADSRAVLSKIMDSTKGFLSAVTRKSYHEKRKKVWRLSYYLRNCTKEREKVEELIKIYENLALNKNSNINPSIIPVATRLAEFETRSRKGNE